MSLSRVGVKRPTTRLLTQILQLRGTVLTLSTPHTDDQTASWTHVHPLRASFWEMLMVPLALHSHQGSDQSSGSTRGTAEQRPHCPPGILIAEGDADGEGVGKHSRMY